MFYVAVLLSWLHFCLGIQQQQQIRGVEIIGFIDAAMLDFNSIIDYIASCIIDTLPNSSTSSSADSASKSNISTYFGYKRKSTGTVRRGVHDAIAVNNSHILSDVTFSRSLLLLQNLHVAKLESIDNHCVTN